jgi:uncharacterized protein (TIGR02145 family)
MKTSLLKLMCLILTFSLGLMSCTEKVTTSVPDNGIQSVTTYAPEKVTTTTAELRVGTIVTGYGNITKSGIFIAESNNPYLSDPMSGTEYIAKKSSMGNPEEDVFSVYLTDLKPNTTYSYVGFAFSESDTCYGKTNMLVTSFGTVTDLEGNDYQTVKIGKQEWMRENLKSTLYSDQEFINGSYTLENDYTFGKHYTWSAATRSTSDGKSASSQGACPTGWHIPSDLEWQELLTYIGVPADQINSLGFIGENQAVKLKDAGTEYWTDEMVNNVTGFSVLPADICNPDDGDNCMQTGFWTSTPFIYYGFQAGSEKILRANDESDCACGISIRCIKD